MLDKPSHDDFSLLNLRVPQKQYLYVRVVKAKDLLVDDVTGKCDPYVEIRLGNYKESARHLTHLENKVNPEWNRVFAFHIDDIDVDASMVEVSVEDKDVMKDSFMGWVLYDLCVVPKRLPSDSPIAPKWYRLEDRKGNKLKGELMLAVWWGTQADEAADSVGVAIANDASVGLTLTENQSKVYMLPRLWYVRVHVIEVKELIPHDRNRPPLIFVKATLGDQIMQTRSSLDPMWNSDMMFVAAEPFEDHLILSVKDKDAPDKNEVLGMCAFPLQYVNRRFDDKIIESRWFNLQRDFNVEGQNTKQMRFAGRIHMSLCLEGGYHVLYEPAHCISDFRPTAKKLWEKSIGILELGILGAHELLPMKTTEDGRATTDAYCVAKYGKKWVRTRTVIDSFNPEWNEQYTWEVFDPCTVITIGVFANSDVQTGGVDTRIGKVRIRVSSLETDRVYTHAYPLFVLHRSGLKKMGEIHLAVRFTCTSFLKMIHMYSQPLFPKMHYSHRLTVSQFDILRHQAAQIVSLRLSQIEPPLKKEIVEYMLDVESHVWSLRRTKANFFRMIAVLGGLNPIRNLLTEIYNWNNPINSAIIHIIFFILVMYPEHILPSVFLLISLIGVWSYRWRPRHPPGIDPRLSGADYVHPDELDEEFETPESYHPTSNIGMRYHRLRVVSGRLQTLAGDIATHGEKIGSLLSWRDPTATSLIIIFCLVAAIVLYALPFYVVAIQTVLYVSKFLRFKKKLPSVPFNFFNRLPTRSDSLL